MRFLLAISIGIPLLGLSIGRGGSLEGSGLFLCSILPDGPGGPGDHGEHESPGELPLARVTHYAGYYDQPHLNAAFRELARMAPTEFLSGTRYQGSVNLAET